MARLPGRPKMAAVMASTSPHEQTAAGNPTDGVARAAALELLCSREQPSVLPVSSTCLQKTSATVCNQAQRVFRVCMLLLIAARA